MAFFNSGSRALVEILTRLQSAERPMPVDHTFFEFGSIRYHVQASASDSENVYLSISTPSLSQEASPSSGLPEYTLQEARKMYHKFAEIIEPPKEGYALTLKLNFSDLARPKDRVKAINKISLLQSVILSSQLKDMLGSLGSSGTMKLVYNQRDPFFVSRMPGMINAIFPMRFRDDTDLAIATSFFQEVRCTAGATGYRELVLESAQVQLVPDPAAGAAREHVQHLTTNGGFVSFGVFSRHVEGRRAAKTAWILLNFQSYVKHHIKCTRSYIQSRMRKRVETLTEVIQNARLRGNDDKRKLQVRKKIKRRLISFAKAKKLKKGFKAVVDKIKRLRLRIKVKSLQRFRRQCQCFAVPKLAKPRRNEDKYYKLE